MSGFNYNLNGNNNGNLSSFNSNPNSSNSNNSSLIDLLSELGISSHSNPEQNVIAISDATPNPKPLHWNYSKTSTDAEVKNTRSLTYSSASTYQQPEIYSKKKKTQKVIPIDAKTVPSSQPPNLNPTSRIDTPTLPADKPIIPNDTKQNESSQNFQPKQQQTSSKPLFPKPTLDTSMAKPQQSHSKFNKPSDPPKKPPTQKSSKLIETKPPKVTHASNQVAQDLLRRYQDMLKKDISKRKDVLLFQNSSTATIESLISEEHPRAEDFYSFKNVGYRTELLNVISCRADQLTSQSQNPLSFP